MDSDIPDLYTLQGVDEDTTGQKHSPRAEQFWKFLQEKAILGCIHLEALGL